MDKKKEPKNGQVSNYYDQLDAFATPVPSFNFEGRSQIGTVIGAVGSVFAFMIVFGYALIKLIDLV